MVSVSCTAERVEGVTLVTGRVTNPDRARRVRVENRLDGPVWPPRRAGVPVEGWDGDAFECVLAGDETRPIGYASPADPVDRPLRVVTAEPAGEKGATAFEPRASVPRPEATTESVVRELDSPLPPRDAVPVSVTASPGEGPSNASAATGEDTASKPTRTSGERADGTAGSRPTAVVAALEATVAVLEERAGRESTPDPDRLRAVAERIASLAERVEGQRR